MKISVLIAAEKAGDQIAGALASVRAQAHPTWEVLVVDCGPTDGTEQIVRDFGSTAEHPVLYDRLPENTGIATARNRLLALATGDPVAFLDPNDIWMPRHLANAAQQFNGTVDVVVSDIRFVDQKTTRHLGDVSIPAQLITNPARALFARDAIGSVSCVTFRRALAERAGNFDERFRVGEGRDFWLRCALNGARFAATHRATCQCTKIGKGDTAREMLVAEHSVLFYEKHRDLAAVPAALRRRLLAGSLVTHGRLLRSTDPARAARCFWRAWSLQPVSIQTLGQFALTGWRTGAPQPPPSAPGPPPPESDKNSKNIGNEPVPNGP